MSTAMKHENKAEKRHTPQLHNYMKLNRLQSVIMYSLRKKLGIQILPMQG